MANHSSSSDPIDFLTAKMNFSLSFSRHMSNQRYDFPKWHEDGWMGLFQVGNQYSLFCWMNGCGPFLIFFKFFPNFFSNCFSKFFQIFFSDFFQIFFSFFSNFFLWLTRLHLWRLWRGVMRFSKGSLRNLPPIPTWKKKREHIRLKRRNYAE